MTISILTCPQCNAMVLSDAARCHVCDHVLDESRTEETSVPSLPTDEAVAEDLEVCANCGESYRRGLVRCWNCGHFTRDEIKAAYDRMAADPTRQQSTAVTLPEVPAPAPEATKRAGPWRIEPKASPVPVPAEEEFDASDDDFSFELHDSVQLTDAPEAEAAPQDEVYNLAAAEPPPAPSPSAPPPPRAAKPPVAAEKPVEMPASAGKPPEAEEETIPHSQATGGDVLLQIAREEEQDIQRSRKSFAEKVRGGFVVYCPMGCRIRVQERHRGKAGKCPKCNSVFFVPRKKSRKAATAAADSATQAEAAAPVEKWRGWMEDVHLHSVVPQKLRIKPDSLLNDFQPVDLVFSEEGLLLVSLVANAGFLGANLKKKPSVRAAVQEHLRTVGQVEGAPAANVRLFPGDSLGQLAMAQPSPADVESLFGNILVFGSSRIAVRLPRSADEPSTQYLSFTLSEFRRFSDSLQAVCGVTGLGANTEVPLVDTYNTVKCHYSDAPVRELLAVEYYAKDPQFKLQITGWRCQGCGLTISEDSRKKEKIGGLNGKGIAKAKCPKCSAKFGNQPMYEVTEAAPAPTPEAATAGNAASG